MIPVIIAGERRFLAEYESLKSLLRIKSNKKMAEVLGVSEGTINNMTANPASTNGGLILTTQEMHRRELKKLES